MFVTVCSIMLYRSLIISSPIVAVLMTQDILNFVSELLDVFVGAEYLPRRNYEIKKMVTFCKNRNFTHIVLINEYRHKLRMSLSLSLSLSDRSCNQTTYHSHVNSTLPLLVCLIDSATVICLPDGPTAHFRLSSVKLRKTIRVRSFAHEQPIVVLLSIAYSMRSTILAAWCCRTRQFPLPTCLSWC
jgi:hypothetical protein